MRPYIGKIFDLNGKPREAQHVVEDVVEVFKSWEDGKANPKVTFRFETPEEGKLCKAFIKIFGLDKFKDISEISSLKNARWVMMHSYIPSKKYPLWALKYVTDENTKLEVRELVDNLNAICVEIESSNPNMMTDALDGLKRFEFELKNLISNDNHFREGFLAFLKTIETVGLKAEEFDDAVAFISSHLQSEVGTWNEDEVIDALKDWRLTTRQTAPTEDPSIPGGYDTPHPIENPHSGRFSSEKKNKALVIVNNIKEVEKAKVILRKIIDLGYDQIFDTIIDD